MTALEKIKHFLDSHKELLAGGTIGAGTSAGHYWEHFTQDENLYKLYDAGISTVIHTVIGAVLLWILRKYVFKNKEK
jgi:hypothetical protein